MLYLILMSLFLNVLGEHDPRRVLMVYSGGTIGMKKGDKGWEPQAGYLESLMQQMPQFQSETLPYYDIIELNPLLDSSAMTPKDWVRMAVVVNENYDKYDGFIVLHGTDTLAYTASVLGFFFENLNKTIVVTGAQTPLCEPYSDATNNLISALKTAGDLEIPEVVVTFGGHLYRGNRVQKLRANSYEGFDSANYPVLGMFGAETIIDWPHIRGNPMDPMRFIPTVTDGIIVIYLHPGITSTYISAVLNNNVRGVILAAFGAGNGPDKEEFLKPMREAINRGVVIVDVTQCHMGRVDLDDYAAANGYKSIGIIGGGDMTIEAAFTKLTWLLAQGLSPENVRVMMKQNLRGELTIV
ncbi:L-asparaginase, putative [Entamoeba invadens IP1]|uniref:asparaginase n=1 Tax=Entamoeba invadens IP1 TaxID=370355 RepID=A0A0A1U7T4_ENTIV|nr:L-asparaginase, putative [Entamoeba invadens IP1]ELP90845.1 L-asparaginase, putative [Entamoeba invadens IP1]|eukprot:XP_004257616.1 L-asparaginase, putative [Entamoeba invadens IP1]